jgi:hypothetical protein
MNTDDTDKKIKFAGRYKHKAVGFDQCYQRESAVGKRFIDSLCSLSGERFYFERVFAGHHEFAAGEVLLHVLRVSGPGERQHA